MLINQQQRKKFYYFSFSAVLFFEEFCVVDKEHVYSFESAIVIDTALQADG